MAHAKAHQGPVPTPRRAHWQALLDEWRRSGLSQAEFCRRRGILPGTLAFWKHTLTREAESGKAPARRARPAAPRFVALRVVTRPHVSDDDRPGAPSTTATEEIDIVLRGDRRVRVRGRVDLQWLGQVVRTLETLGC